MILSSGLMWIRYSCGLSCENQSSWLWRC